MSTLVDATTPEAREAAWREHATALELELGIQRGTVATAREYVDELEAAAAAARGEIAALRTQLQRLSEECADLQTLVDTDALTGAWTRRWLADAWAEMMEAAALILLDLDGFKDVNDELGHEAGDDVLQVVAERLADVRPGGVVRLGGDEFAVIVPAGADPGVLVDELRLAVGGRPIACAGGPVDVMASIGYAAAHPDLATTLRRADTAMYHAKRCPGCPDGHDGPVQWRPGMAVPPAPERVRRQVRGCPA